MADKATINEATGGTVINAIEHQSMMHLVVCLCDVDPKDFVNSVVTAPIGFVQLCSKHNNSVKLQTLAVNHALLFMDNGEPITLKQAIEKYRANTTCNPDVVIEEK